MAGSRTAAPRDFVGRCEEVTDVAAMNANADDLSEPFVNRTCVSGEILERSDEIKPRWNRCAESTEQLLGKRGERNVEKFFLRRPGAAQEMVANIIAAMHYNNRRLTWMGPRRRRKRARSWRAECKIGIRTSGRTTADQVERDDFWKIGGAVRWNVIDDTWNSDGKPTDRRRWGMTHDLECVSRQL